MVILLPLKDFILERRPEKYEFSDIDMTELKLPMDKVTLVWNSQPKWDPFPSMLCQNHTNCESLWDKRPFNSSVVKSNVLVMDL
jgi:hypothetical protein